MASIPKKLEIPDRFNKILTAVNAKLGEVGDTRMMRLSSDPPPCDIIPTGSLAIDRVLGVGGYPQGRIVEVYGPYSCGKTTLTLHAIAQAQARGGIAAFIDAEHALDPTYAKKLGVKTEDLLLVQPDFGEQAMEVVDSLTNADMFGPNDIIVVDSVAALTPKVVIEGDMDQAHMAVQARLMAQALNKLKSKVAHSKALLYFTNQIRDTMNSYGPTTDTPGGHALKFYSSVRLEVKRTAVNKAMVDGEERVVSINSHVRVIKNKVAPPFRECDVTIRFGEGISVYDEILEVGLKTGIIQKNGAYFKTKLGVNLGQGKENSVRALKEQPELTLQLRNEIETEIKKAS